MRKGFSKDGYITDQDHFSAYKYRGMTSNYNGCGWIAAYNLRRAQGHDVDFESVHRDMNALFPFQIPGPTPVWKLRLYLARHGKYQLTVGKKASLAAAEQAPAGILRYWEGKTPHFVPFIRQGDGRYRFLNVNDRMEDFICPMDEFIRGHCIHGLVRVITPKE